MSRRLVLFLVIASLIVPAVSAFAACCSPQRDEATRLSAACCCEPAARAPQTDLCDLTVFKTDDTLTALRQRLPHVRVVTSVSPASDAARVRCARATGPPSECSTSVTVSAHGVSLPLRV